MHRLCAAWMLGLLTLCWGLPAAALAQQIPTSAPVEQLPMPTRVPAATEPPASKSAQFPLTNEQATPLDLRGAMAQSLANVQVVQASVATRSAEVGRLDALKSFLPLVTMPQLAYGLRRAEGPGTPQIAFPGITLSGSTFDGAPKLDRVASNGVNLFFPLDPSGQITAMPVAEHGIKVRELMEQLARRSQLVLAAQHYFDAKQVPYNIALAEVSIETATEAVSVLKGRLQEQLAFAIEVQQAEVDLGRTQVNLASVLRQQRLTQRQLGVTLHKSRLLIPQDQGPFVIEPQQSYQFLLDNPDLVDLTLVPDFPHCREEAIALAKRQRYEVRILVEGVTIARLQEKRNWLRLFGLGSMPWGLANRELKGRTSLGLVFGTYYEIPGFDLSLWANLKRAKLDLVRSELDLERGLMDAAQEAGNAWDRLVLAEQEYVQRQRETQLAKEQYDRQQRRYREAQAIKLEVLGAQLNHYQATVNLWTAWYNLQLARLDVLRATELLLPYVDRLLGEPAGSPVPVVEADPNVQHRK